MICKTSDWGSHHEESLRRDRGICVVVQHVLLLFGLYCRSIFLHVSVFLHCTLNSVSFHHTDSNIYCDYDSLVPTTDGCSHIPYLLDRLLKQNRQRIWTKPTC